VTSLSNYNPFGEIEQRTSSGILPCTTRIYLSSKMLTYRVKVIPVPEVGIFQHLLFQLRLENENWQLLTGVSQLD
jgi:hypothetical protein